MVKERYQPDLSGTFENAVGEAEGSRKVAIYNNKDQQMQEVSFSGEKA